MREIYGSGINDIIRPILIAEKKKNIEEEIKRISARLLENYTEYSDAGCFYRYDGEKRDKKEYYLLLPHEVGTDKFNERVKSLIAQFPKDLQDQVDLKSPSNKKAIFFHTDQKTIIVEEGGKKIKYTLLVALVPHSLVVQFDLHVARGDIAMADAPVPKPITNGKEEKSVGGSSSRVVSRVAVAAAAPIVQSRRGSHDDTAMTQAPDAQSSQVTAPAQSAAAAASSSYGAMQALLLTTTTPKSGPAGDEKLSQADDDELDFSFNEPSATKKTVSTAADNSLPAQDELDFDWVAPAASAGQKQGL